MQARAVLKVLIAVLEHFDSFSVPSMPAGEFDYAYNTLNQPDGTFAVGTIDDWGSILPGHSNAGAGRLR